MYTNYAYGVENGLAGQTGSTYNLLVTGANDYTGSSGMMVKNNTSLGTSGNKGTRIAQDSADNAWLDFRTTATDGTNSLKFRMLDDTNTSSISNMLVLNKDTGNFTMVFGATIGGRMKASQYYVNQPDTRTPIMAGIYLGQDNATVAYFKINMGTGTGGYNFITTDQNGLNPITNLSLKPTGVAQIPYYSQTTNSQDTETTATAMWDMQGNLIRGYNQNQRLRALESGMTTLETNNYSNVPQKVNEVIGRLNTLKVWNTSIQNLSYPSFPNGTPTPTTPGPTTPGPTTPAPTTPAPTTPAPTTPAPTTPAPTTPAPTTPVPTTPAPVPYVNTGTATVFAGSGTKSAPSGSAVATSTNQLPLNTTFALPTGVEMDYSGNLTVYDLNWSQLTSFTNSTTLGNQYVELAYSNSMRFNPADNLLYMATSNEIQARSGSDLYTSTVNQNAFYQNMVGYLGDNINPNYFALKPGTSTLYYGDGTTTGSIYYCTTTNATSTLFSNNSGQKFGKTGGLIFDSSGNLYIVSTSLHCIFKINTNSVVSIYAGSYNSSGLVNDVGPNAKFNSPTDITMDTYGNFYVTDSGNNCVRKLSTNSITIGGFTVTGLPVPYMSATSVVTVGTPNRLQSGASSTSGMLISSPALVTGVEYSFTFTGAYGSTSNMTIAVFQANTMGNTAQAISEYMYYPLTTTATTISGKFTAGLYSSTLSGAIFFKVAALSANHSFYWTSFSLSSNQNVTTFVSGLNNPTSICIDRTNLMYVANTGSRNIVKIA